MPSKKLDIVVRFFNRLLRIRATSAIPKDREAQYDRSTRTIDIRPGIRGKAFFVWLTHETVHHSEWHVDEAWVEQYADDLGELLYRDDILRRCGLQRITTEN